MQVSSVATAARIDGPPRLCVGSLSASDETFDLWELRLWVALSRADHVVRSSPLYTDRTIRMVPVRFKQSYLVTTLFSVQLRHSQPQMHNYFQTYVLPSVSCHEYVSEIHCLSLRYSHCTSTPHPHSASLWPCIALPINSVTNFKSIMAPSSPSLYPLD
jgi:hypothetical protein